MAEGADGRVRNLQQRLWAAIKHIEGLRREATDMAAELRNRLHTVTAQREALRRLDGESGERRSRRGAQRDEQTGEQSGDRDRQ
jgi:hypothetical protein